MRTGPERRICLACARRGGCREDPTGQGAPSRLKPYFQVTGLCAEEDGKAARLDLRGRWIENYTFIPGALNCPRRPRKNVRIFWQCLIVPPRTTTRKRVYPGRGGGEGGCGWVGERVGSAFESKNTPRASRWKTEDHLDRITGRLGGTQTGQRGVGLASGRLSISVNIKAVWG